MEKRIRIVWCLTIITLILITTGQIYWLYRQSIYEQARAGKELFKKCESLIQKEDVIRSDYYQNVREKNVKSINPVGKEMFLSYMSFDMNPAENKQKTKLTLYEMRQRGEKYDTIRKFKISNMNSDAVSPLIHRYQLTQKKEFNTEVLDSLMQSASLPKIKEYRFIKTRNIYLDAAYTFHSGIKPYISVTYLYNPLKECGITFDVPLSFQPILKGMAWQLVGCIFLVVLLIVCMLYQIKTILFQKRIDGIRREFMKNMIYEMKQTVTSDDAANEFVMIGDTRFYYSMNELRYGEKTVIVTSRQAEIIKILSDRLNETVPRNEILEKVWGDDSYSNSMALNVQITYIRRAFSSDSSVSIEAIMKKGYLMKAVKQ